MTGRTYLFGPFRFEMGERLLYRGAEPIPLTPKAAETLYHLLERHGTLIEKTELMRLLWPDTTVEEATLSQNIFTLRKVLGDDGRQYIETVPRRGFRFIAAVREADETEIAVDARRSHRGRIALIVSLVIVLAGAAGISWKPWMHLRRQPPQNNATLAVLPFHPLEDDRDQYLGVAMADALISRLSNIRGVLVRPTSAVLKFTTVGDSVAAGRELGVGSVVEGTIQRAGGHIRVSVQLVDVSRDVPRWSDTLDVPESDVFSVQDRISEKVAAALLINLKGQPSRYTESAAAHNDYLRGRYFWNKRTADGYKHAIDCFQSAIEKDPSYALAYDGLADSYALLGSMTNRYMPRHVALPKALAAVHRALQLDDNLAEAHASLGFIKMHYEWDWEGGEREFQRAIQLNPAYPTAHHWYAYELIGLSRFDEAIREIREAQKADPVSIIINSDVAEMLFFAGRYDEAVAQCHRTLELDPNFALAYWILSRAYRFSGHFPEAVLAAQKGLQLDPERVELLTEVAASYRAAGQRTKADNAIAEWRRRVAGRYDGFFSDIFAALATGDRERAFTTLEQQYAEHSGSLILLNVEPSYAVLRDDARFKSLVHRVGLDRPPSAGSHALVR